MEDDSKNNQIINTGKQTEVSDSTMLENSLKDDNSAVIPRPNTRWTIEEKGDKIVTTVLQNYSFTIDRPVREVWPIAKDFNLWLQDLKYIDIDGNEVVQGDSEGETIYFTILNNDISRKYWPESWGELSAFKKPLRILKVIPEKLIISDAIHDETHIGSYYVFTLHEDNGKTIINMSAIYPPYESPKGDREKMNKTGEVLRYNADGRWNDFYIPTLRALVEKEK